MEGFKRLFVVFFILLGVLSPCCNNLFAQAAVSVDTSVVHQTIEGFGAAIAWEVYQLGTHSDKVNLYYDLFTDLGLDILRLRNIYGKSSEEYIFNYYEEIVDSFYSMADSFAGVRPKVMISSWTPPASLKSSGALVGGTLDTLNGEYRYGDFTQYWIDALDEFDSHGIVPDYISIQNEPDWGKDNPTCRFDRFETDSMAGYNVALDSVYNRVQGLSSVPKLLAPEVLGIGGNNFQNYANQLDTAHFYGYAYHLYYGGSGNVDPDVFISPLTSIGTGYADKPIFQTEYDVGGWFNTAWLIHNCLVDGRVSGYVYWWLVCSFDPDWPPIIKLNGTSSYTKNKMYWAFRQYSRAIHYGWKRVNTTCTDDSLRVTAFVSPDGADLSVVIVNISHTTKYFDLSIPGFDLTGNDMVLTNEMFNGAWAGTYNGSTVRIVARSIMTISTLYIEWWEGIEDDTELVGCSLAQNYPNPFYVTTTIEYSTSRSDFVRLAIYDISGREVKTLLEEVVPAGKHEVSVDMRDLSSGIYIYRLETGGKRIQKKMVLVK